MNFLIIELVIITVFSYLFALGEFISLSRNNLNWYLIISFISLAKLSLHGLILFFGGMENFPFLLGSYIPFLLLLGPFFSFFIIKRLQLSSSLPVWIHLIPALASLIVIAVFHSDGGERAKQMIKLSMHGSVKLKEMPFLGLFNLHYLFYVTHVGFKIFNSIGFERITKERTLWLTMILLIHTSLVSTLLFIGFTFRDVRFLEIGLLLLIIFLMLIYLIQRGFPDFFIQLEGMVRQARYKNSRLKTVDLAQIQNDLNKLMTVEKIYCDEEISLAVFADELGISSHQLSEYFNQVLNKSFIAYINEYRIRDAQRLLIEESETTVLAIAYQVGFNSKSAFNAAFLKETGCSPTVYRRKKVK